MNSSAPKLPAEFEKQVREACKHYNKPERIGKLPIASLALQVILLEKATHPTDLIGRGKALQSVIKENLLKLEPEQTHTREWEIYLCLSCYVYQRAYSSNTKLKNVQAYIEAKYLIPKATYNYRLKKEGIPELSYLISSYLSQQLTWVEPIPQIVNFIGRENEFAYYHQQLVYNKIVVIEGIGGIGKTALAAQLATSIKDEDQRAVCWVTLRAGLNDSTMALLYAWGVFLAQHDYPQLWAFMRATATEEKRLPEYYPILKEGLAKVKPVLCIDNLELLPKSEDGFWELLSIAQQEVHVSLLLISQQRPQLPDLDDYDLLSGLSQDKVGEFLIQRKIQLTNEQLERVVNYTNGNLRLLDLWTAYVKQQDVDVQTSLEKLLNSAAADAFLTSEVIGGLTTGQKQATKLLAFSRLPLDSFILQTPPRHLSPLSDLDIEDGDFERLQRLGLIQQHSAKQWTISPLLKDHLNSSTEKDIDSITDLHEWLANLYLSQSNTIEYAYHLIRADETEPAFLILSQQKQRLIQQGQGFALSTLLNLIEVNDLPDEVREILLYLRMELGFLLAKYKEVKENALAAEKEAQTELAKAHAEQILGEVEKQTGNFEKAIEHYKNAQSTLIAQRVALDATLKNDLACALAEKNDLDNAWKEAQHAQMTLNNTLGNIAQRRGNLEFAQNYYYQAIKIGEKIGQEFDQEYEENIKLMPIRNSLAVLYWQQNKLEEALLIYEKNLVIIEKSGNLRGKAITLLNIGLGYVELGKFRVAIEKTREALKIFNQINDKRSKIVANQNLAEQYLQIKRLDQAEKYAKEIVNVDEAFKTTREYAEGLRIYAEVLFAQEDFSSALEYAIQGLDILRKPNTDDEFTDPFFAKRICETLVSIYTALGNTAEAEKYDALAHKLAKILEK